MRKRKELRLLLAAAAAGAGIWGCSGLNPRYDTFAPEVSSIYVSAEGKIRSATVEPCQEDYYSQTKLEEFIAGELSEYNEEQGAPRLAHNMEGGQVLPVSLVSCSIEEGKAVVIYEYGQSSDFVNFAEAYHDSANTVSALETRSVSQGQEEGWFSGENLTEPGSESPVSEEKLNGLEEKMAVMVESDHPITVMTGGKILYITGGAAVSHGNTAELPEGKNLIIFE